MSVPLATPSPMSLKRVADRPIILGIVGDSAAGKSTFAAGVAQILGEDRVTIIALDDYHKHSRAERRRLGLSALDPRANHMDVMEQHIRLLREGQPILKPVYDHSDGTLRAPVYVQPKDYVIVEGLLGYTTRAMRDCYDVKVYLEPEEDLRVYWKITRDTSQRGYAESEVRESLQSRGELSEAWIRPQRTFADMVVQFVRPEGRREEVGPNLVVRHTLRPTLPHPDLSPILEGSKDKVSLTLARDIDGKPVDVLEISGDLDDKRAKAIEDLLWNLIPEASHLRAHLGQFMDDREHRAKMSHPLALSQLLITYHLVKAAMGHYAI
ncbi:phosphoribulokinase [Caenispirillum bisanense]|uniref:Phosphoribulokinase n=1 Tax=Caenispirillum bisanense TaxID=414052 RepID=A0A286GJX4_9PROT|nr:phosphoribulokinase [Caenispirillum bisanense]SOD95833.1 phosphoribulokinase [Caenispirillum bisanense]